MPADEYDRLSRFYAERVAAHEQDQPGYGQSWGELSRRLVAAGGQLVVPPMDPEPHVPELLAALQVTPGDGARRTKGATSRCHENSAGLWLTGRAVSIGTGYALSGDGLWRQHSWAFAADGTVLETTERRVAYAGVTLAGVGALRFALSNAGPSAVAAAAHSTPAIMALVKSLADAAAAAE